MCNMCDYVYHNAIIFEYVATYMLLNGFYEMLTLFVSRPDSNPNVDRLLACMRG